MGSKLSLFLLYGQWFLRYRPIINFQKLPYLGMKLGKWPKCQKLHICPHFTPGGEKWAYIRSVGSGFRDMDWYSKLPCLGMKLGHWPKFHIHLLLPPRVEIKLNFALRAAVSEIWAVFQKCRIWAWNLARGKSSWNSAYTLFPSQGVEIELIFALWAQFPRYGPIFKIAIFGHET